MSSTINNFIGVSLTDFHGFVEMNLKRFRNVDFTASVIKKRHFLSDGHEENVRKQAKHVAYCLTLAQDYLVSAKAASSPIKPVLIYYSLVNFALAEVLIKQNGDSSLDKARQQNSHHGLEISFPNTMIKSSNLVEIASGLIARPHQKSGKRTGTFNLWQTTAREHPVIGKITTKDSSSRFDTILSAGDSLLPLVAQEGLSLIDCVRLLPSLDTFISGLGIKSHYGRGHAQIDYRSREHPILLFTLHPDSQLIIDAISERMLFSAAAVEDLDIMQYASGFALKIEIADPELRRFSFPMISSVTPDDLRICSVDSPLNEFGAFLYAFYILGNLCRYFPDEWLPHIERHSDLALLTEGLCEEFFIRVPALVLGELGGTLYMQK